jgi:hypothetical protein
MVRFLILLCIFILYSCISSSQELIFKEYVKESRNHRRAFINQVSDASKKRCECSALSNIWKLANGKYYSIDNKTVLILNDKCELVDSLLLDEAIIDLSVHADLLIVSITSDEVEYYSSRIFMVNLSDKSRKELNISPAGVKFGLNISNTGESFSFIHEDETSSVQKLMVYKLKDGHVVEVDRQIKELSSFGDVGFSRHSYWLNDCLYYTTYSSDYKDRFLFVYDLANSQQKKLKHLSSLYSLNFKITKNGNKMILLKREDGKYKYIVSVDMQTDSEQVLYQATGATLSDLDDFEYIE